MKKPFPAGPGVDKGAESGNETRKWTRGMNYKTEIPVKIKKQKNVRV